jgi:hypothetical protein
MNLLQWDRSTKNLFYLLVGICVAIRIMSCRHRF